MMNEICELIISLLLEDGDENTSDNESDEYDIDPPVPKHST